MTMTGIIDALATQILALPVWVPLLVVLALPVLESSAFVGVAFPCEIALVLGGVLAFEGQVPVLAVLVAGITGAILGDSVGYLVGRRHGQGLPKGPLVNHQISERAERYLADRGGKAVFFVLLGYLGGSGWRHLEPLASRMALGAFLVAAGLSVGRYAVRRNRSSWGPGHPDRLGGSRARTWLTHRFPRQAAWVGDRLDPRQRTGLLLTVAVAVALGSTWTFLGVTQDVHAHEEVALFDPRVHAWLLAHRTPWLNHVMVAVPWFGSNTVLVPVLAAAAVALRRTRGSWSPAITIGLVYSSAFLSHAIVKELVRRPRPPAADWLVAASGWSYPSGHTIQATVAWGVLLILLAAGRSAGARALLTSAAALLVLLVAASRVYLGVHWLSDVLGSMALGVALLSLYVVVRLARERGAEVR